MLNSLGTTSCRRGLFQQDKLAHPNSISWRIPAVKRRVLEPSLFFLALLEPFSGAVVAARDLLRDLRETGLDCFSVSGPPPALRSAQQCSTFSKFFRVHVMGLIREGRHGEHDDLTPPIPFWFLDFYLPWFQLFSPGFSDVSGFTLLEDF